MPPNHMTVAEGGVTVRSVHNTGQRQLWMKFRKPEGRASLWLSAQHSALFTAET